MSKRLREWRLSRARVARAEKHAASDPPATAPDPPVAPLGPPSPALGMPATAPNLAAPAPDLAEKFVKEAHDLDAVRKSVEDAAAVSGTLWFSYLFALFYLGIAAGGVMHKDLLLESPVKLPFLGVDLPLVAFFFLAPIIFIVSHAYTLVHFVMLAAKAGRFEAELIAELPRPKEDHETREGLRRQLPSNIFVQFLVGPGDVRKGALGWLLKAIAWISLVIGPVLLLLLIQVQFLPYHLEWVTWVQRIAIFVDVVLLWFVWPAVLNGRSEIKWPPFWRHPFLTLGSLVPIGFAFTAATFPGEALDYAGKKQWIPPNLLTARLGATGAKDQPIWTSFHDLLFNGEVDEVTRRRKSFLSNTLVLPGFDALEAAKIEDPKKLDSVKHTLSLRGRHLESAVFYGADLRKADLEGAYLQGASLIGAQLQRASLNRAELQGVMLFIAQLQGANLDDARLQGAWLFGAQLQGANLDGARLQGASLFGAQLQGANLGDAWLQGASLSHAQLQGADFRKSTLAGTSMGHAAVWRTNFEDASLTAVFEDGLEESVISKDEFAALKAGIMKEVTDDSGQDALKRIQKLNPDLFGPEVSQTQTFENARAADYAAYQKALADQLKSLVCSGDEAASYIVRALGVVIEVGGNTPDDAKSISRINRITASGHFAPDLIESILSPVCPVSATLTEADKAALSKLSADEMQELVCMGDNNALNILRGFLNDGHIKETGDQAPGLADAILDPKCPVSTALAEADKAALKEIAKKDRGAH